MTTIGIDYTPAYEQGAGIGRLVRELVNALAQADTQTSYKLFVAGARSPADLLEPPGSNFTWHTTRLTPKWLARLWHRARISYPVERWIGPIDLFHATDFVLPPVRSTTRTILTVHDLSFVHVPEAASPSLKAYLEKVVPRSVRRADHVLADSQATKNDLVALYNTPEEKITVLLSGVDAHFKRTTESAIQTGVRAKYDLGTWPFLFTVGTVQPRKNYARLCEALARLQPQHPTLHLVIAGGRGWLDNPIYETVERLGLSSRVHFIGYVDDMDLPVLYSMAEAVSYVSLYEGFGFPVLEAMACGTPVVASNVSSIPEVTGEAALLVDPTDTDAIAAALHDLLSVSAFRDELIQKGYQQASRFSWKNSAQQLRQVYTQVLAV